MANWEWRIEELEDLLYLCELAFSKIVTVTKGTRQGSKAQLANEVALRMLERLEADGTD